MLARRISLHDSTTYFRNALLIARSHGAERVKVAFPYDRKGAASYPVATNQLLGVRVSNCVNSSLPIFGANAIV